MTDRHAALGLRRVAAFGVDWLVIAFWAASLLGATVLLAGTGDVPASGRDKALGWLLAFASLTLPAVLYAGLLEGRYGWTLGKRLLGLRVGRTGQPPGLARGIGRNAVKFAQWELAHAAIWLVPGRPFVDPMPSPNLAMAGVAMLIGLAYVVSLFIGDGRTPYDRVAGTRVVRRVAA